MALNNFGYKTFPKIHGCEIQDKSTSISIEPWFEQQSDEEDGDESDKHMQQLELDSNNWMYFSLKNLQKVCISNNAFEVENEICTEIQKVSYVLF